VAADVGSLVLLPFELRVLSLPMAMAAVDVENSEWAHLSDLHRHTHRSRNLVFPN
jgi:hypothetical protein